jgi:hypothetical protein
MQNGGIPDQLENYINHIDVQVDNPPFRMVFIIHVAKLPVIAETTKIITNLYGRVRVSKNRVNVYQSLLSKAKLFC